MAHSAKAWHTAKTMFEAGRPLSEIEIKTGISKGQISKKSNAKNWKKETTKEIIEAEVQTLLIEDDLDAQKETIRKQKETLSPEALKLYEKDLKKNYNLTKKTHTIATNFQDQILHRQNADAMALEALIALKAKELSQAETPEDILKVNLRFREYLSVIADYDEMKKGVEANDKAMISKGEAPRHAPKADTTVNTLTVVDTEAGTKGKW